MILEDWFGFDYGGKIFLPTLTFLIENKLFLRSPFVSLVHVVLSDNCIPTLINSFTVWLFALVSCLCALYQCLLVLHLNLPPLRGFLVIWSSSGYLFSWHYFTHLCLALIFTMVVCLIISPILLPPDIYRLLVLSSLLLNKRRRY